VANAAVPAAANALLSLEEVKDFLEVRKDDQDDALQALINSVSEWAESRCNRALAKRTFTWRLPCAHVCSYELPAQPVDTAQPLTVAVDQITQTVWKAETDGDPSLFDVALVSSAPHLSSGLRDTLFRSAGWGGAGYRIVITATAGWAVGAVPGDLRQALLEVCGKLHRDSQKKVQDVVSSSGMGGSVAFIDTDVPRRSLIWLDRYRRRQGSF
jgi:uncharacterized phiE125 gp8 family phage protein